MIQPCPGHLNCEDVENPVANLTSEAADQLKCFRFAFTPSSSLVCEFPITVCNDYARVGSDVGVLCAPPDSIINGTNPAAPIIYSSNPQSCTVDCGDGTSETYEVVAGTFVGLSQPQADAAADSFACQLAALLCNGPLPALFTSTAQTCVATCVDGSTVSYITPAGFFSALSQAEANFAAFMFACDVAALLCNDVPPTGILPGAGTSRPPVEPLYANFAQSCSSTCSNGSVYVFTAPGGLYLRESRLAANAVAASYACDQANRRRTCLSDLDDAICAGTFSGDFIDSTGLSSPVTFSLAAGALPPGMILDSSGFYQGIPTTAGTYAFAIRGTGSDGNFVQRTYSQHVIDITPAALPDGTVSTPYAEALDATGTTGFETWTVTDGALPDGLSLNPNTGVISGTPTDAGTFAFTVSVSDES